MKYHTLSLTLFLLFSLFLSCADSESSDSQNTLSKALTHILVFDPQGESDEITARLNTTAPEGYRYVSMRFFRNGTDIRPHIPALKHLTDSLKSKGNVHFMGFSGGARLIYMLQPHFPEIDLFVGIGAGFTSLPDPEKVILIAGERDFNFNEMISSYLLFPHQTTLLITNHNHEWPSSNWIHFANGANDQRKNIEVVSTLQELSLSKESNDQFTRELNQRAPHLAQEVHQRQDQQKALFSQDLTYWKNHLQELKSDSLKTSHPDVYFKNQRTLSFLGIMIYMISEQLINQSDLKRLEKITQIYAWLEPENEIMMRNKAWVLFNTGNQKISRQIMDSLINNGLIDQVKLNARMQAMLQ